MPRRPITIDTAQRIERARFWAEKLAEAARPMADLYGAVDDETRIRLYDAAERLLGAIAAVNKQVDPTPGKLDETGAEWPP
jgi:hypothetical protein